MRKANNAQGGVIFSGLVVAFLLWLPERGFISVLVSVKAIQDIPVAITGLG